MQCDLTRGSILYGDPFSLAVAFARTHSYAWRRPIDPARLWPLAERSFLDTLDDFVASFRRVTA